MPTQKASSNSFFSNSVYIFLIRFFPSVASQVILIYYSHYLDKPVYGTYQNFWIQLNFIYPLACFGIHAAIITYSPSTVVKLARSISKNQYILYGLWLVVLSVVFALLQSAALGIGFIIPLLFIISFCAGIIMESFLIVFKNFKSLVFINVVYAAVYLAIHVWMIKNGFSFYSLFLSLLALSCARVVISAMLIRSNVAKHSDDGHVEVRPVAEIRTLWMHLAFYDILQTLSNWIDKFVISIFLTTSLSAIYFNGTQNIPFLPIILSAAGSSVLMQMTRVKAENERGELLQLMNNSARYASNIVFPLFFFLIFFRYELFKVLLPDYMAAVPIFFVSLFMIPFRAYSFITVFQKLHKGHLSNIGAVGELILACALMYPLYKWLGLPGVALSFIISSYSQGVYYFYHISRLLNTSAYHLVPVMNWLIKCIVYAFVFISIHYIGTMYFSTVVSLTLGIAIMVMTVILSLFIEVKKQGRHVSI